jgi:integration host factor subunit beta
MLKPEVAEIVTKKLKSEFLKRDVAEAINLVLESIVDALEEGRRVEIRGFGSFSVRQRKARITENPKTGKIMKIPPRKTVHFAMSKSLRDPLAGKTGQYRV